MENFSEAEKRTKEMFEEESGEENLSEKSNEQGGEGVLAEGNGEAENSASEAASLAEAAAEVATEKDKELSAVLSELKALREQNEELMAEVSELSKKNEEKITEEVIEPPELNINELAFADEETQRAATEKFAKDLTEYAKAALLKELSPVLEYAKCGMRDAEKAEVIEMLSKIPELSEIKSVLPQLDGIIKANRWLSADDMPLDERYINAFAVARGINSINNPQKSGNDLTADEFLKLYESNSEFKNLVEKKRIDELKAGEGVPQMSAAGGGAGAALNIKDKPKTFDEAAKRTREMFK